MLSEPDMIKRWCYGAFAGAIVVSAMIASSCSGRGSAAEEELPRRNPMTATAAPTSTAPASEAQQAPDPRSELKSISAAIPIYAGARYREDLTRRDSVNIRNEYGPAAQVITMATDDSFPQVYHYYTTYLAQFRAYPPQPPFPPQQNWRTLEVQLNQAMQDPFIPGDTLRENEKQVTLQVAETEAEPRTVIRYIITPAASAGGRQVAAAK